MAQETRPCKAYACFTKHEGKIFDCWVDEYFPTGCKETNFDGNIGACMEYWTNLHDRKGTRCFVKIYEG